MAAPAPKLRSTRSVVELVESFRTLHRAAAQHLLDTPKMELWARCLADAVRAATADAGGAAPLVLDASGKFGVPALLALRAGAAEATVLAPAERAKTYTRVAARNGLAERVRVLPPAELSAHAARSGEQGLVLIVDVGSAWTFASAIPRGLAPPIRAVARTARAYAACVHLPPQPRALTLPFEVRVCGFDLSAFHALGFEEEVAALEHAQLARVSEAVALLEVDVAELAASPHGARPRGVRVLAAAAAAGDGAAEGSGGGADGGGALAAHADISVPLSLPAGGGGEGGEGGGGGGGGEAAASGARCNAVVVWWELELADGEQLSSCPPQLRSARGALPGAAGARAPTFVANARHGVVHVHPPLECGSRAELRVALSAGLRLSLRPRRAPPAAAEPAALGACALSAARWHFPMMHDLGRNGAYEAAIRRAVERAAGALRGAEGEGAPPPPPVLDIGAGSGLLAMMAARAGAPRVLSAEVEPHVARAAQRIVAANGLAARVQVVRAHSSALTLEPRAPLVVSEILDVGLLGEGVLPALEDAWARLLAPGAACVPCGALVHALLAHVPPQPEALNFPLPDAAAGGVCGVDVSPLAFPDWQRYSGCRLHELAHTVLSAPFDVFEFDFTREPAQQEEEGPRARRREARLRVRCAAEGPAPNAVVFWFTLRLDAQTTLSTAPSQTHSCWGQAVQLFPEPLRVEAADAADAEGGAAARWVPLIAKHTEKQISFGQ